MIKRLHTYDFFNNLTTGQMIEFIKKCDLDMKTQVLPVLQDDDEFVHYEHFIRIPGCDGAPDLFLCADASYLRRGPDNIIRKMRGVRLYESEMEMHLFMAASEYSNDPEFMTKEEKFIFN